MNENTFQSQQNHTRIRFEPLTTSCHLRCLTPQSPCAQTIDVTGSTPVYNPNRLLSPCVIYPDARATDPDNIFPKGAVNGYFGTITWLVNGVTIDEVWTVNTDYAIDTSNSDLRGMLTIYKNLPASEKATLKFKATFMDWRTKAIYAVESDEIILVTTDKGTDVVSCSVDKQNVEYDPLYDDLLLYDYLKAYGLETASNRDSYVNAKNYLQTVTVSLTSGTTPLAQLPSDITMRVVYLGGNTALVPNSEVSPELVSAIYPTAVFDMRNIDKKDYEIQFLKNGSVITKVDIGLHRKTTMPVFGKPLRNADIPPALRLYSNMPVINIADRTIQYPEIYYLIRWFTQAIIATVSNGIISYAYDTPKEWQCGPLMQVPTNDIGIGHTYNDNHFQLWFTVEAHGAREVLTDENGEVLTDENGEILID